MKELLFSTGDIARITADMNVGIREASRIIGSVWEGEKPFLEPCFRNADKETKRKFILRVLYNINYIYDKLEMGKETSEIKRESENDGRSTNIEELKSEYSPLDFFFKKTRIRILYGGGNDYAKIKMRSLITDYGKQRRTDSLVEHFEQCMLFYHLEVFQKGGLPCDIKSCKLDTMLIFRVV